MSALLSRKVIRHPAHFMWRNSTFGATQRQLLSCPCVAIQLHNLCSAVTCSYHPAESEPTEWHIANHLEQSLTSTTSFKISCQRWLTMCKFGCMCSDHKTAPCKVDKLALGQHIDAVAYTPKPLVAGAESFHNREWTSRLIAKQLEQSFTGQPLLGIAWLLDDVGKSCASLRCFMHMPCIKIH